MMSDLEATVDRNIAIHGRCENTVVRSVEDAFGEQCPRKAEFFDGLKKLCQECWEFINGD